MHTISYTKILLVQCTILITLLGCNKDEELPIGGKIIIRFEGKGSFAEIQNNPSETTIALVDSNDARAIGYISDEKLEFSYFDEKDGFRTTIVDSDGDGIPEYKLTEVIETGEVTKQEVEIVTWRDLK